MKPFPYAAIAIGIFSTAPALALDSSKRDDDLAAKLSREGTRYEGDRAVSYVEKGSLSAEQAADLAERVNRGIVDIERFLGLKFDTAHFGTSKIAYFVGDSITKSHVYGGYSHNRYSKALVFLPARKVKDGTAPYLHETTHILAWSFSSLWLREGFATYVQNSINARSGRGRVKVFGDEMDNADVQARELVKAGANAEALLAMIGKNGLPEFSDPMQRRMFYVLSESFVSFLGRHLSIDQMKGVYFAKDTRHALQEISARTMDEWKKLWLVSLEPHQKSQTSN